MTLIIETGTGVRTANAYASESFVTQYLTSLGRQTEASWDTITSAQREAAIIAATQYIETRWGPRFKGVKAVAFNGERARALLTVAGQPLDGDTIVVGTTTFTLVAALDDFNENEIEIGATTADTIENIILAVQSAGEVDAALRTDTTDQILLVAEVSGTSGNDTPLSSSATNITVTAAFQHGRDSGSQPLSFPRAGLYDDNGIHVAGVPLGIKQAMAEYAVRAAASSLYSDPSTDDTGRIVQEKTEKVGPLEETIVYAEGAVLEQLIKPYPAADRMVAPYVTSASVIR